MAKHILVVAHGSRRVESNHEIQVLAKKLALLAPEFDSVNTAFLEMAEPSIPAALEDLIVKDESAEIIVLPYFLAAGRHVVTDVPAEIDQVKKRHPQAKIKMVSHLGAIHEMPGLLLKLALTAE